MEDPGENRNPDKGELNLQPLFERMVRTSMEDFQEQFMQHDDRILHIYSVGMELWVGVSEPDAAWNLPDTFGVYRIEKYLVKNTENAPRGIVRQTDIV